MRRIEAKDVPRRKGEALVGKPIEAGLFEETKDGVRLIGSRCRNCGTATFPSQASCAKCTSLDVVDELLPSTGLLWSWTVQRFRPKSPPYTGSTEFEPFGVGYVELPGACRVESRLVGTPLDRLVIGLEMEVTTMTVLGRDDAEVTTFAFAPVGVDR